MNKTNRFFALLASMLLVPAGLSLAATNLSAHVRDAAANEILPVALSLQGPIRVVEGSSANLVLKLKLPQGCGSVDMALNILLSVADVVLPAGPNDIGSILINRRLRTLPFSVPIRGEALRGEVLIPITIDTVQDELAERDEPFGLKAAVDARVKTTILCHRQGAPTIKLGVNPASSSHVFVIEDHDRDGGDEPVDVSDGPRRYPSVAGNAQGTVVICFEAEASSGPGIFCFFKFSNGERKVVQVGEGLPNVLRRPLVKALPDGRFFIAFEVHSGGGSATGEFGASTTGPRIDAATALPAGIAGMFKAPDGGAIIVAAGTGGAAVISEDPDAVAPRVAIDRSGRIFVVWRNAASGQLWGRLLGPAGAPLTEEFLLTDLFGAADVRSAMSASGDSVLVWRNPGMGGILAQRRDEHGSKRGDTIHVDDDSTAQNPDVAIDARGNFVVVYDALFQGNREVFARLFDRDGRSGGPRFQVNLTSDGDQYKPLVARNSSGDFVVVWHSGPGGGQGLRYGTVRSAADAGTSIVGRHFEPGGEGEEEEQTVAESEEETDPEANGVDLNDDDETTVVYEKKKKKKPNESEGVYEKELDPEIPSGPCVADVETLCLGESGRFRLRALWDDGQGTTAAGQGVALTGDTGYFWFFGADNVEIVAKMVPGCGVNEAYWVFAAGLTNVEVTLIVDDTVSGKTRTYFNGQSTPYAPVQDTSAFAVCDDGGASPATVELSEAIFAAWAGFADEVAGHRSIGVPQAAGSCASGVLCLGQGRFEVTVDWSTNQGTSGAGTPVPITTDTGYFWFFNPENVEVVVKVLDACVINNHYWVFAGGLTDVSADLMVRDTLTGGLAIYQSAQSQAFQPIQDTLALDICP